MIEKKYVRATSKRGWTMIQGVFVSDDGTTVTLFADGENRYCRHADFIIVETDVNGIRKPL